MAFSYSLVLALVLLLPGFAGWAGWRAGESTHFTSPRPDVAGSTVTLFIVVVFALLGHLAASLLFGLAEAACGTRVCVRVPFEPNVYKAMLAPAADRAKAPSLAMPWWLVGLMIPALLAGLIANLAARRNLGAKVLTRAQFGWIAPYVEDVRARDVPVVGYVVTKIADDGLVAGYEGLIHHVVLDQDKAIASIVLQDAEPFIVEMNARGFRRRRRSLGSRPLQIPLLALKGSEISNVALRQVDWADAAA